MSIKSEKNQYNYLDIIYNAQLTSFVNKYERLEDKKMYSILRENNYFE